MPDLRPEIRLAPHVAARIAGVDEAGRGPLAGPVVAAAVILPPGWRQDGPPAWMAGVNDSKVVKKAARDRLFAEITATLPHGIGIASVAEIDQINILNATLLAMARAVAALPAVPDAVLVDGNRRPRLDGVALVETLVDGDALSLSIAAASIIAKVTRDNIMGHLARTYPGYGWESNQGYGTAAHLAALRRLGVTPEHRRTFAPVSEQLALNL